MHALFWVNIFWGIWTKASGSFSARCFVFRGFVCVVLLVFVGFVCVVLLVFVGFVVAYFPVIAWSSRHRPGHVQSATATPDTVPAKIVANLITNSL
jgi:hypothetical protein